jgi:hypothetical protein
LIRPRRQGCGAREELSFAKAVALFVSTTPHPMVSHAVKAFKEMKNDFRIELPYSPLFVPIIGLHLSVWTNPLAFTNRYYQTRKPRTQQQKLPDGKTNFSSAMRTLENIADAERRTEVSRRLGADQNSSYISATACVHSLRF